MFFRSARDRGLAGRKIKDEGVNIALKMPRSMRFRMTSRAALLRAFVPSCLCGFVRDKLAQRLALAGRRARALWARGIP